MQVKFSKNFQKQFQKLGEKKRWKVLETIEEYRLNYKSPPQHLRLHSLKGQWSGYKSISAGGDLRIHFYLDGQTAIVCAAVGSHSQLY